jgi:Zn-dependent protease
MRLACRAATTGIFVAWQLRMSSRRNPLLWAFPVGTWFGVRLRISWFFPVALVWFVVRAGAPMGLVLFGMVFLSVLLHEIGHILAARSLDGSGDEILLWPLGGLASVDSPSHKAQFWISLGGPVMNLLLCGLFLPAALASKEYWPAVLDPRQLPLAREQFGGASAAADLQVLMFWVNWLLLLINLLPAFPLDGGQALRAAVALRRGTPTATEWALFAGFGTGVALALANLIWLDSVPILCLAFLILLLTMQEYFQLQMGDAGDESFMGYDFSQGYTSLERAERVRRKEAGPGLLRRWLARRRDQRQQRLELERQEAEKALDAILAKVHERGIDSLTPSERRLLKRASERFRGRGKPAP